MATGGPLEVRNRRRDGPRRTNVGSLAPSAVAQGPCLSSASAGCGRLLGYAGSSAEEGPTGRGPAAAILPCRAT